MDDKTAKTPIYLYKECVTDLPKSVEYSEKQNCNVLITLITNPNFRREFFKEPLRQNHCRFTRSELLLEPSKWHTQVVAKLSEWIDCDSVDDNVRKYSEAMIKQEIAFSQHVAGHGQLLVKIRGTNTSNLARTICAELTAGTLLVEMPMVDYENQYANSGDDEVASIDTWHWWNLFRSYADYNARFQLALELTADLPTSDVILRWLGEPIELLIIPIDLFINNRNNFPVLPFQHKTVALKFLAMTNCKFALKVPDDEHRNIENHVGYLRHLYKENAKRKDPMIGYDDLLEVPLQPLYDNLDSYTYEVFEKDPVKYIFYQRAIEQALVDKISDEEADSKTAVVMVVGAGRGPLVRSAFNASTNVKRKIKIYVVEKNPNAIITLTALQEEMWKDKDMTIISTDMRYFEPAEKVDIMVSELLGSFGDNELSPECLDGAQRHLKPDGVSIPCQSTSYLNPIMAPKLLNVIREVRGQSRRCKPNTYEKQAESTYVVYLKNVYHITEPQPVFTFVHPNNDEVIDNSRFIKMQFDVEHDCVMTGFAGYFDTVLYKDIKLSIHPKEHTRGLISWFSLYFPLSEPQQLHAGDKVTVNFWRCVSNSQVWYEWSTTSPYTTHVHNLKGWAVPIYK